MVDCLVLAHRGGYTNLIMLSTEERIKTIVQKRTLERVALQKRLAVLTQDGTDDFSERTREVLAKYLRYQIEAGLA